MERLQSCPCPVKKIYPEKLNWPSRLAGISEGVKVHAAEVPCFLKLTTDIKESNTVRP